MTLKDQVEGRKKKMIKPNMHYGELKDSYLFYNIAQKTKAYEQEHPGTKLLLTLRWLCRVRLL